ncbi:MAG TPA: HD domain-containing phosphohydrolase [Terriglobia bacterium]|jgi:response regulator RpfG family c-di-GMP phosphodiesterase|nr:HD domain-containing phosphohydrolase [Terriglobia bacterium]
MTDPARKARILVVDHDPAARTLIAARLVLEGHECVEAKSAGEAHAKLEGGAFDLVLSGLHLPDRSGLELLKDVHERSPHLPFVICTTEDDVRTAIESMKLGAADYLLKPVQLDLMVNSVERALQSERAKLELEGYQTNLEDMVNRRTRQLQAANKRIEYTYDETLAALGGALELRDIETQGHSRRVTHYCLELARALHCPPEDLRAIARGSFLHDIGKIGIPDAILLKPDRLTPEETELMQTHVRIGYELVCRIAFLTPAAQIVLTHHERWDGTGYPQGLRAQEIPPGARIFAVADTLDAMTSDRPYRASLPFEAARDEIGRESGHQFDPETVRVFLQIPEAVWRKIRREATERPQLALAGLTEAFSKPEGSFDTLH